MFLHNLVPLCNRIFITSSLICLNCYCVQRRRVGEAAHEKQSAFAVRYESYDGQMLLHILTRSHDSRRAQRPFHFRTISCGRLANEPRELSVDIFCCCDLRWMRSAHWVLQFQGDSKSQKGSPTQNPLMQMHRLWPLGIFQRNRKNPNWRLFVGRCCFASASHWTWI